jgi:hypothetical protein
MKTLSLSTIRAAGLALMIASVVSCNKGKHEPAPLIAFSEASVQVPFRMKPNVCAGGSNGKRFSVIGYPRWNRGLLADDDPLGGGRVAYMVLVPTIDADAERGENVSFRIPIDGWFTAGVESPKLENVKVEVKRQARNTIEERKGRVSDDSIRIHLAGGDIATQKTPLRVSLEIEGGNGTCNLKYVGALPQ